MATASISSDPASATPLRPKRSYNSSGFYQLKRVLQEDGLEALGSGVSSALRAWREEIKQALGGDAISPLRCASWTQPVNVIYSRE